jgi:type IV pilus assembly protein PilB
VVAQRLVRVVCAKCKQAYTPPESVLRDAGVTPKMAESATFARGKGCGNCNKSGYRGRIGIYELMLITAKIREAIFENRSSQDIRKIATSQGMKTLYHDGIFKVLKGITTFEEVYRVTKRTEQDVFE